MVADRRKAPAATAAATDKGMPKKKDKSPAKKNAEPRKKPEPPKRPTKKPWARKPPPKEEEKPPVFPKKPEISRQRKKPDYLKRPDLPLPQPKREALKSVSTEMSSTIGFTNISGFLLAHHKKAMDAWYKKEWDNLINKQDCAVDAVKLEWLIKSNQPAPRQKKGRSLSTSTVHMSKEDESRLAKLMTKDYMVTHVPI